MNFQEDLLHFVWKLKLFNTKNLYCTQGNQIEIQQVGIPNSLAGPDFQNAKIKIGTTLWSGNVEMHLKASDWYIHKHQEDGAYESVILHVVALADQKTFRKDGTEIPTLVLNDQIEEEVKWNYRALMQSKNDFPCQFHINEVDGFTVMHCLQRMMVERLEEKSAIVRELVAQQNGNWDEAFYIYLARNFGFKINALPFELLAKSLPQKILAKYKNNRIQIEALLFGNAGFLHENHQQDYPKKLWEEYQFLKKKHLLNPLEKSIWKFLRLRPQNFPTLRIAQFAALILKSSHLFSVLIEINDIKLLKSHFENLKIDPYWNHHYIFEVESPTKKVNLGIKSIENILLNTVSIFLFAFGKSFDIETYVEKSLSLLEQINSEKNTIVNKYTQSGLKASNALQSQGILQLNKNYCNPKKCLQCVIGVKLIKK